ncbi:hypothetical protein [Desulfatitalea alkaliphila]|uniref:Uncharacterized protein n=1 Tax=Desulfatitalea alkaliphila TaxID=2929485 RepID=A0AA41UL81_9BACT|nr:hypothetical protein [Desulfatitalea alkaliphila]MCJ8502197.1 hypothetical protein [Desulfatitalea alkaliphila]
MQTYRQLLTDRTPVSPSPATISVPMLIEFLKTNGAIAEANAVGRKYLDVCNSLVIGHEFDKAESDLVQLCPSLSLKQIRKNSYASLFYEEVRSSYVHEYRAGKNSASLPMTGSHSAKISYVNMLGETRRIHFHVMWLSEIALCAAKFADSCPAIPLAQPSTWWIEG